MSAFSDFEEFFPYYVSQHSKATTRWLHFAGTHAGVVTAVAALVARRPRYVALAPVIAYGLAWYSHFAIEKNRPATFGRPLWALRGDLRMLVRMWQGRDAELDELAADSLADQQPGLRVTPAAA